MPPRLGPVHRYPYGTKLHPTDRGGLNASFGPMPTMRAFAMNFATPLQWVALGRSEASAYADMVRKAVQKRYGNLPYNVEELPFLVGVDVAKQIVTVDFRQIVEVLVMNPEAWLALAQRLDEAVRQEAPGTATDGT